MPRMPTDLLYGTLDVLVLKTLSWGPMHGYAIAGWIGQRTGGALAVDDAALYKALHRLERQRLVEGEWGHTEQGKRAKFYRLTAAGRRALHDETSAWERYAAAVHRVLAPA